MILEALNETNGTPKLAAGAALSASEPGPSLGRLATARSDQPAEHPDHDQVQQADRYEPRSSPTRRPRQTTAHRLLHLVLKRRASLILDITGDHPSCP